MTAKLRTIQRVQSAAAAFVCHLLLSTAVHAAPPIRTSDTNRVPSCVSPERLMSFLRDRNENMDPRYRDLARWYKHYGEAWRVRWDYAFYQMVLETNYLKYRRGDGHRGDVHERQNNFAGIGATGGGVAGERFSDIKTGVHAQIQHLVAYSGERVNDPVAKRTDENQDDIIAKSRRLKRAVTFGDLARRWAADRAYARSIDIVAKLFNEGYCKGPAMADTNPQAPTPQPAKRPAQPSALGGPKNGETEEVLPWATTKAKSNTTSVRQDTPRKDTSPKNPGRVEGAKPAKPAQIPQKKPVAVLQSPGSQSSNTHPPVRTLWSRSGAGAKADDVASMTAQPGEQAAFRNTQTATSDPVSEQARPMGLVEHGQNAPQLAAVGSLPDVQLPYFRITPLIAEPSRLGGPIYEDGVQPLIEAYRRTTPPKTIADLDTTAAPISGNIQDDAAANVAMVETPATSPPIIHAVDQPAKPHDCSILSASYGGQKTLLVQSSASGAMQLTALTVLDGFEDSMLAGYTNTRAPDSTVIGTFKSKDDALAHARSICPTG